MTTKDLSQALELGAAELGRLFLAGDVDPVEVTEAALDAIVNSDDPAVFLEVTSERARTEALASRDRYRAGLAAGPLDGVPLAWKDLFDMRGEVTTAGSATRRNAKPAERDAPVVAALSAAGMVAVGKTNLTEFAYSGIGINPHFGTPRNPWSKVPRMPGGSSSGSAVAVARNLVPAAIGSDTGGSVRIPAALNGVVGFKTSGGRISRDGVFPLSRTLDTVGPIARRVEDCWLLDRAMAGMVPTPLRRVEPSALEILVPRTIVLDALDDAVAVNFERSLSRLSAAGARVRQIDMPAFEEIRHLTAEHGTITAAEAYALHRRLLESDAVAEVDPRVAGRILAGKAMSAFDLAVILGRRETLIAAVASSLGNGLLAMPTVAHVAAEIAPLDADPSLFQATNLKTLRNTLFGNFLDLCGLALPNGRDRNGLPTSILLNAKAGDDERLLGVGIATEALLALD